MKTESVNLRENSSNFDALQDLNRLREAALGKAAFGFSTEALTLAWADWLIHLAGAPGKRLELGLRWTQLATDMARTLRPTESAALLESGDPRFAGPAWQSWPYHAWAQSFLLTQDWWRQATRGVPGTNPHHEAVVSSR